MNYKLLALDTSTSSSGYALYENGIYQTSSTVKSQKGLVKEEKLSDMISRLYCLIDQIKPNGIVTEYMSVTRNAMASNMLSELLGSIRGYCIFQKIDYCSLRPTQWRSEIVRMYSQKPNGRKREDLKAWSLDIVNNKLGITTDSDDEAEAILLGLGYINSFK